MRLLKDCSVSSNADERDFLQTKITGPIADVSRTKRLLNLSAVIFVLPICNFSGTSCRPCQTLHPEPLVHAQTEAMKTFSNPKRDIRTFYKPKSKNTRRENSQEIDNDVTEAQSTDPGIQLASRPPTAAGPDEVQATRSSGSYADPVDVVSIRSQAVTGDHEQDVASNCSISLDSDIQETANDSTLVVEKPRGDDDSSVEEMEDEDQELDSEDTEPLTFEEVQLLRDRAYTKFGAEEPEDFTDGPARFVESADGAKNCVALLVTYDLSQKIQAAIRGQNEFSRIELEGLFRRQSLIRLEDNVHREIFSCKARLCGLEKEGQMETEDVQRSEQQLANLQLMLPDIGERKQKASVDVNMQAERLRDLQAAVNANLEEAFICAHLIAPHEKGPEPEIENLDVSQEYLKFCQRLEGPDNFVFDNERGPSEVPPPAEEEQARQAVMNSLWAAKETLDLAHRDFGNRENDRAREYEANVQAADRGEDTTDESPEAFDVRWVVRFRNLTRALMEAEAVYADVKRQAFEAGVSLPFVDNESVFEGVGDNTGYTISKEQELAASVPSPTVRKWLSNMPEGGETGSVGEEAQLEADEWDAEEVGISDSVSLVAEGRQRSRIDRWQDACLAEKSQ